MALEISPADWKLFRQVHRTALERFCEDVLSEIGRLVSDPGRNAHDRYLAVFKVVQQRDKELADAFDDLRRSSAFRQLAVLRSRGLLTDEEFARFSPTTQAAVQAFALPQ